LTDRRLPFTFFNYLLKNHDAVQHIIFPIFSKNSVELSVFRRFFMYSCRFSDIMAVKPTTQVFSVRDGISTNVDLTLGQGFSELETVSIPTQLDTLNREVLMIQEVDFDIAGMEYLAGAIARTNGAIDPAVSAPTCRVDVFLTEVDPAVDPSALQLASPHFIAGASVSIIQGLLTVDYTPDTGSYGSVAFADHPLFTTASENLFFSFGYTYQGNDPSTAPPAKPAVRGMFRTFNQRGRADADTYAAILTGLYA